MVEFLNIVKITTTFQNFVLSREIRDLRTCNPGVKKFLNFLKNRFPRSESSFESFRGHVGICNIYKYSWIFGNICDICHPLLQGKCEIWTARGKTLMNSVEDTCKYLLAFSGAKYSLKSCTYSLMKFYLWMAPDLNMKMSKFTQTRRFTPNLPFMFAARGKFFLILATHTYEYIFWNLCEIILLVDKTTALRNLSPGPPNSIIQDIQLHFIRRYARHDI